MAEQWEYLPYQIENSGVADVAEELNRLGQQGWELAAETTRRDAQWLIFKRPVAPERFDESPETRAMRAIKGVYAGH